MSQDRIERNESGESAVFRTGTTALVIEKPGGDVLRRDVLVDFNAELGVFEFVFIGETPLKGYRFSVLQTELKRIRDTGNVSSGRSVLPR